MLCASFYVLSCLIVLHTEKLDVFDSDFNDSEGDDNEVFDDEGVEKKKGKAAKRAAVMMTVPLCESSR